MLPSPSLPLVLAASPALAQDASDRTLLAHLLRCRQHQGRHLHAGEGISGPARRACDVKLLPERYSGQVRRGGNPLLVVNYDSGCEPRANDDGGAVVFEQAARQIPFRRLSSRASRVNDCIVRAAGREAGIAGLPHRPYGPGLSRGRRGADGVRARLRQGHQHFEYDFLLRATDSTAAYGANVVTCKKKPPKYFELSKLAAGPRQETVAFDRRLCRCRDDQDRVRQGLSEAEGDVRHAREGRCLCAAGI